MIPQVPEARAGPSFTLARKPKAPLLFCKGFFYADVVKGLCRCSKVSVCGFGFICCCSCCCVGQSGRKGPQKRPVLPEQLLQVKLLLPAYAGGVREVHFDDLGFAMVS